MFTYESTNWVVALQKFKLGKHSHSSTTVAAREQRTALPLLIFHFAFCAFLKPYFRYQNICFGHKNPWF